MTTPRREPPEALLDLPGGLPPVAFPPPLRDAARAKALDHHDIWNDMAADGHWLADWLWPHWAATLERDGVTSDHLAQVVAGYRRELWLWVVGERTWPHTLTALAGRVVRRPVPAAEPGQRGSP